MSLNPSSHLPLHLPTVSSNLSLPRGVPRQASDSYSISSTANRRLRLPSASYRRAVPCIPEWGVLLSAEQLASGAMHLAVGTLVRNTSPTAAFGTLQTILQTRDGVRLAELRTAFHIASGAETCYAQQFEDIRMVNDNAAGIVSRLRLGIELVQEVNTPFAFADALQTPELIFTMKTV